MRTGSRVVRVLLLASVLATAVAAGEERNSFDLRPTAARLRMGDASLAPVRVSESPGPDGFVAGGLRIEFDRAALRASDPASGERRWEALLPAGRRPEVLAHRPRPPAALRLEDGPRPARGGPGPAGGLGPRPGLGHPGGPPRRRTAGGPAAGGSTSRASSSRSPTNGGSWRGSPSRRTRCASRRTSRAPSSPSGARRSPRGARPAAPEPTWIPSHLPLGPGVPHPLLFQRGGAITYRGDHLLLLLPDSQDLLCVHRPTGEEEWRVARVWEFERRYPGSQTFHLTLSRAKDPALKAALATRCRVTAGPVTAPWADTWHAFVVVERGHPESPPGGRGPLPEPRVYEIDARGDVVAVTTLPRPVVAHGCLEVDGGVLLDLGAAGVARVEPSPQREAGLCWGGAGGTDLVVRLAWWREPSPFESPPAWLATGAAAQPLALAGIGRLAAGRRRVRPRAGRPRLPRPPPPDRPRDRRRPVRRPRRPLRRRGARAGGDLSREGNGDRARTTTSGPHGLWLAGLGRRRGRAGRTPPGAGDFEARVEFEVGSLPR